MEDERDLSPADPESTTLGNSDSVRSMPDDRAMNSTETLPSPAPSVSRSVGEVPELRPIKTQDSHRTLERELTADEDLLRQLSRRRSSEAPSGAPDDHEQISRLLSRIFGQSRQETSEEEKTRHLGVVFRDLTVKGLGFGASLQPTNSDLLLGPVRKLQKLLSGRGFGKRGPVRILINEVSGCIRPGEMLLVLGKPGAGCTTFLKALGNQRSGYEEVSGEVKYGGEDWSSMAKHFRSEVLYNPEDDLHYATLTVKNTLKFALQTKTPGKESRAEGESRGAYVREFLRVVAKLFWIEHAMDTKVGNAVIRGISGGEKKRVSIAEALVTKASCQCWDNSTRGLDASTAMEYVSSLRSMTNMANISTAVALYQAGESLYELFDKVLLIDQGRCAYIGRTDDAKKYFEDLGFVCPPRWTTADFLTSVTDPHERHVKPGWEDRVPRTSEEFKQAFKQSNAAVRNEEDIAAFEATVAEQIQLRELEMSKATHKKNYTISFPAQVMACTSRQFKVMIGDRVSLGARWIGVIFQSIIVGSLFYNLPKNARGAFPKGGILFFTLLFNALMALAELTAAFDSRPILMKHKSFSFYRPSAYAIAQVVADLPLCGIQVLLWSIVIYWMANLGRTASQFFIFILITFFLTMAMYSFFRMIGAFAKSLDGATRVTGVAIQALIVYTGYLIPPGKMHPWFSWLRWINPVQYSFEALMANEFNGLEIECVPPFLVPLGPGASPSHQSCTLQGGRPGNTVVRGEDYIRTQFSYTRSHLWRNFGIVIGFWLFFAFMTAVGLELQKPNKGGAAVTVFKRGEAPSQISEALDKGGPAPTDEESNEKLTEPAMNRAAGQDITDTVAEEVVKHDTLFTWQNVTYTIPTKAGRKTLLNNISGYVRPGRLTALMGESGAGKTTLLNALAQRINFGDVEGTFLVNGQPLPLSFQRATGFAEQQDVHEGTTTVREAMQFSALLRQPKEVPIAQKYNYVETIIDLLEMRDLAGATVGEQGVGLNQEQRKRLTIGVELASKPDLLMFLDEPTSGLDSAAAFNIVRFLRKLADNGQAILCTIHQPSAVLFEQFDELILLKSGGSVVYHGPLGKDSQTMIGYFEHNGARRCPPKKNPAEYMLEAIGAGDPNRKEKDWGEVWVNSEEYQKRQEEIVEIIESGKQNMKTSKLGDKREFAMPWTTQVIAVLKRNFISYWRTPEYTVGLLALHIFTGLFNSFTFYKLGFSSIDMQSRLFSIFMLLTIAPPLIHQLQPRFLGFRDLFTARENNSKIYHWSAIVIAAVVTEIPYRIISGTLYFVSWYFPIAFPRDSGTTAYTWLLTMLFELYYTGLGQAIASVSSNELLASLLVPFFFIFVVSFCGVVVPYNTIPTFWRSWMYWLSPFTYLLEGFLGVLTHNVPVRCAEKEFARFSPPNGVSCDRYTAPLLERAGGYVETDGGECKLCQYRDGGEFAAGFHVSYAQRWRNVGIVVAFVVFNFAMVFVGTWLYLGRAKKLLRVVGFG